jgi:general stress protein 26
LIQRAGVAMLVNIGERGSHVGRPMLPLFLEDDPHIYFLTHQSSRMVDELMARAPTAPLRRTASAVHNADSKGS